MVEGAVAGVDWAKDTHEVLIANAAGQRLWGSTVTHDEAGLSKLCSAALVQRAAGSDRASRRAARRPAAGRRADGAGDPPQQGGRSA
jgi:hypothetical protein